MKIMKLMIGMILLMAIMPGVLAAVPISTCQDLQNMQINLAGEYYLTQDIDCSNTSTWNSGAGFMPVGNESSEFTGTFDGQGHIVGNLYINRPSTYNVGLFGWTLYAEIKNIGVENVTINGHFNVGGLVGDNGGPVSNSYSTGIVNGLGSSVGGLVGVNAAYSNSQVSNSYSTASVNANDDFGGLVGYNDGTISNSYSTGSVNRVGECGAGGCDAGGLLGWNNLGTTSDSFWDIQTSGQASSAGGTGKTTAEMKQNATFSGWDFADIWRIAEGMTSPQLRWQRIAISTCQDLQNMQINLAGEYYLANDVNCTDTINWNSGAGFMPVNYCSDAVCWTNAPFTGKFDGQNHTISNLYINRPSRAYVGLFGYTLNSEIKNVGLIDVNIHGYFAVGGLAGNNYIGGTITNCYSTGSVSGDINVGGLAGYIGGNISSSYSTASVSGSGGDYGTGGLVGQSSNYATITNSYSTGSVSGNNDVGGLIGAGYGPITNSYSTGSVSGNNDVGGLVGVNEGGGWDHFGPILNSFWDMQTSGQDTSAGGTGKTTAEMQQQATFVGWDFTNIWNINEGISYPFLQWQEYILPACESLPGWGCGYTVTESCMMTQDLDCSSAPPSYVIFVNGATLDCAGHILKPISGAPVAGIYSSSTIKNCVLPGPMNSAGISTGTASSVSIINNTIYNLLGSSGSGITLGSGSSLIIIRDNRIYNYKYFGIFISSGSNNNNITGNIIYQGNSGGIYISGSNNLIENNNISNISGANSEGAISFGAGGNNTIRNNRLSGKYALKSWSYTSYNTITNNILSGMIYVSHFGYARFYNNLVNTSSMPFFGITYQNFLNTTKQPGTNIVGGPNLGGNYWAFPNGTGFSQTCADSNSDGICDSAYCLDNRVCNLMTDYIPLANPAAADADSDSVADEIDNCPSNYNPDQLNIDAENGGDVCDICPACAGAACCEEQYSDAQNVDEEGATIVIEQDSVLDIPENALIEDTSISITKGTGSNFKICMPESGECGITVSTYTIGPTGQTFNNDYTLKLSYGSQEECSWGACEIWYSDDEGATWSNPWGPPAIENGFLVISANHFTEFAIVVVNKTYVQNVTIALDASDPTSGIADTGYCIDSVNECTPDTIYSAPFLVEGIGMHYIRYQSYDNAGNVELIKIMRVNIIESCDSSPPIIEILTEGVMGNNNWFVSIVNWTIRAIDNISGMKTLDYSIEKQ